MFFIFFNDILNFFYQWWEFFSIIKKNWTQHIFFNFREKSCFFNLKKCTKVKLNKNIAFIKEKIQLKLKLFSINYDIDVELHKKNKNVDLENLKQV